MISEKTKEKIPEFFILAGCILWGMIGLFSSYLSREGCTSVQITFIRNGVATMGLWLYLLIYKRERIRIRFRDLWMFIGTGVVSITFFNIMYFKAIELTTLATAAVLLYTAPFFVMIFSFFLFGEKISKKKISSLILAGIGCLFVTGMVDALIEGDGLGSLSFIGILAGFCSGIGYALYSIFGNIALKKYNTETVTAYSFLFATIVLAPFCLNKSFFTIIQLPVSIKASLGIGLVSTLCPFLLYTKGLASVQPGKASGLAYVEPAVGILIGTFVLNQKMSSAQVVGIVFIFLSLMVRLNKGSKQFNKKVWCEK